VYGLVLAAQQAAIARCLPGVGYREVHRTAGRVLLQGLLELGLFRGTFESLWERGAHALFFPHGVGHLLGLDVHDLEDLGDRAGYATGRQRSTDPAERYLRLDRELQANMVVTIEPGFYCIPGLLQGPAFEALRPDIDLEVLARLRSVRGIRIEDDVLVTAGDPVVLSAEIPKRIEELERCVGG
jgi:Xaa-Pro aminopeptidase